MWLLRTSDLQLKEFFGAEIPPYAILSHTWTDDEVTFQEIYESSALGVESRQKRLGHHKVSRFCELAKEEGHEWAWIDSSCIDKRSSAELSEAISSMYTWYKNAQACMVYLADVPGLDGIEENVDLWLQAFKASKWFKRGWTLQELIASTRRTSFATDWTRIASSDGMIDASKTQWVLARYFGDKIDETPFITIISDITRINLKLLLDSSTLEDFCIAERMSWASLRNTTRPEDGAYSLMGLFGVNMPIPYGEGLFNAFERLQDEIMKNSFDQTIFAW
ncbi:heterokaryon incompatibility protein-domain-containing protein, partial [Paraphoma chrysanthemicola]